MKRKLKQLMPIHANQARSDPGAKQLKLHNPNAD
jgi:hypothetical protein